MILHAGDVVGGEVLARLATLSKVAAVAGNNDLGTDLPAARVERVDGVPILVVHDVGPLDELHGSVRFLLEAEKPKVVVSGHSHKGRLDIIDGVLFVNPGSAGKKRFTLLRSAALLIIDGGRITATLYSLETSTPTEVASLSL